MVQQALAFKPVNGWGSTIEMPAFRGQVGEEYNGSGSALTVLQRRHLTLRSP